MLQADHQFAQTHRARRARGVEHRLRRHLGRETETPRRLGAMHLDGRTLACRQHLRHLLRRGHGLDAEAPGARHAVQAMANALDLTGLGQPHQRLIDGRTRAQPCEQRRRERLAGRLRRNAFSNGLGCTHTDLLLLDILNKNLTNCKPIPSASCSAGLQHRPDVKTCSAGRRNARRRQSGGGQYPPPTAHHLNSTANTRMNTRYTVRPPITT
ncbi:hypothetical protein FQZ97_481060 [compost metagenome]